MSEHLAEASVLIRPDTTKFRAELKEQLRAAMRGVVVSVPVVSQAARATAGATAGTTKAIQQQTTATKQNLTAKQQAALADRQASAEATRLARANDLVAAAQRKLVAVEEAGKATTTELAKARAQLRAANNAVLASQRAVTAAELQGAEGAQAEAAAALQASEALVVEAKAAETAAIANAKLATSEAAAARKNEQFRRGIEASGLSVFGFRAATLAASSSFLIGATAVEVLRKSVEAASHEAEAAAQAHIVFGDAAAKLEEDAKGLADTIGVSTTQALRFESALGNIFTNAGFASAEIAPLSEEMLKLAADMAAARNVSLDKTLQAISLALVGNSRGLRAFGIELNAAAVNQEALKESGKTNTDQLTRQEKIQARLTLIRQQSNNFEGAAERRAHSLAGETRRLNAQLENLGAALGTVVIPALKILVDEVNRALTPILKLTKFVQDHSSAEKDGERHATLFGKALHIAGEIEKRTIFPTVNLIDAYNLLSKTWKDGDKQIGHSAGLLGDLFNPALAKFGLTIKDVLNPVNQFVFGLQNLEKQLLKTARAAADLSFDKAAASLARLNEQASDITIAAGGQDNLPAQLDNLIKQQQQLETEIAAANAKAALTQGVAGHATAIERRRQAKKELADNLQQQVAIRKEMADNAAQAAQDILDAVQKAQELAQKAMDEADAATQETIERIGRPLDIKQLRADATESLVDNVALENARQATIKQQLILAHQIIDEKTRSQLIHDLTVQLVSSELAEKALIAQQKKNRQQRRAAAFDRAAESIDLDIELAQTNKNVAAEIAARRRRIALDIQRQQQVKGDILATKRLRNDIAAQRQAIKELEKELKKRNEAEQQLEFAFLQRQTGFVTNLLSNLLPTQALAGTVSTTGTPPRAISPAAQPLGDSGLITRRGVGDFATDKASKATPGGVTTAQGSMTISVLRQILHVLQRIDSQRKHPEAAITKAVSSVNTDFFG